MNCESEQTPPAARQAIDPDRLEHGAAMFEKVYHGVIPAPPAGFLDFADIMLSQLFAEQWARPQLAMRDRRMLTLATIAAVPDPAAVRSIASASARSAGPSSIPWRTWAWMSTYLFIARGGRL